MRGFPLLQLAGIVALFVAAGWPVWSLTRSGAAGPAVSAQTADAATSAPTASQKLTVELHFDPAPTDFQLTCLGQPLLAGRGPAVDFSVPWIVRLPPEGADLALQAHWPVAPTPTSARVTVFFPDGHGVAQILGGDAPAPMVEVVTIKP